MRFPRLPHLPILASICLCLAVPTVVDAEILLLDLLHRQRTDAFATPSVDTAMMENRSSVIYSLSMLDGNDTVEIERGTVTGSPMNSSVDYAINMGGGDDTLRVYDALIGGEVPFSKGSTPDITGGAGNDKFDIQGGTFLGNIFGGSGDDRMELYNPTYLSANDVQHQGPTVYGRPLRRQRQRYDHRPGRHLRRRLAFHLFQRRVGMGQRVPRRRKRPISLYGGISAAADERGVVMHGSIIGGRGDDIIKIYDYAVVNGNVNGRVWQNQYDSLYDKFGNDEVYLSGIGTVNGNIEGGWGDDILSVLDNSTVAAIPRTRA